MTRMRRATGQDRAYRLLRALYDEGSPSLSTNTQEVGRWINASGTTILWHRRVFEALGILRVDIDASSGVGRTSTWHLLVDQAEAYRRLDAHFDAGGAWGIERSPMSARQAKTAIREEDGEPVEAIAGPDPVSPLAVLAPLRKDEGRALIEAARQYVARSEAVITKLEELEALGVTIDRQAMAAAITMERDERLEYIAEVVDYVTGLEKALDRQERLRHAREVAG